MRIAITCHTTSPTLIFDRQDSGGWSAHLAGTCLGTVALPEFVRILAGFLFADR